MPKLPKIFYGWWMIIASSIIMFYNAGIVIFGFTAFFDPIIVQFGWSYAQVSLAASLRGAETGLVSPLLGYLVDRWGSKWIFLLGGILVGTGLIFLSRIETLAGFYGGFVFIAIGISACGPATGNPVAIQWFRRRLGLAMGIISAASAVGGLLLPLIIILIDSYGWRDALMILGIGSIVISVPLSLLIRRRPENYGYSADGDPLKQSPVKQKAEPRPTPPEVEIGARQALASRTFWFLALAFTMQYITISAVIAHIMPFLDTVNINRSTASFFAAAIPLISVVGRMGAGWLSDKMSKKRVSIGAFILITIGTLLFEYVSGADFWVLILAVVLFSLSYGSSTTIRAVLLRQYFGKGKFGTIFGFLLGIISLGSILGPFLAGWIFDSWNSYSYAWLVFTALNIVALVLIAIVPKTPIKAQASGAA
jgi:sugar phosphate permease